MTDQAKETSLSTRSLSEKFNACEAAKMDDHIVKINSGKFSYTFDFVLRHEWVDHRTLNPFAIIPFSQVDHEVLEAARDKLIDLGGHPPETTLEAPAPQATTKGLRL